MTCTICKQPIASGQVIIVKGPHKPSGHFGIHAECLTKITGITTDAALTAEYNAGVTAAQTLKAKGMPTVGAKLITPEGKTTAAKTLTPLASHAAIKAKYQALKTAKPTKFEPAYTPAPGLPLTQKAKGIKVLQGAGMLQANYAQVAQTEAEAIAAAHKVGLPCFCRPCPITPRHGFVDSREVKTDDDVRQVWTEARAQDPQAELILMPFIKASHNMVWRPGLLSVGPGHDGATAGHDSVSIFLQPEYSGSWKNLATKAGCDLSKSDPFIEAVSSGAHETVLTQIRAGVKGAPTASDWNPKALTVGNVITIDPKAKAEPDAMLKWEMTAKGLKAGHDVVWNPGGNLGDHWSVHAQLAGVTVITSYKPKVGDKIDKVGEDLVPLEPQAIIFGYLGGLLEPDLTQPLMRKRAVCASLLGSHHGMRMGGDAGVFIGASVAMMLRLAQAALWGESRHAKSTPLYGSRDQIYKSILNDWYKGRVGLLERASLFWTYSWPGGYGGPKWAACAKATIDLDTAMLDLIRVGSRVQAKKVLATLTNVVNLAHNNGWWLNKFCTADWFDMAADLDPRVAIMAGPAWYDAATAEPGARMALLAKIEALQPIDLTPLEKKYGVASVSPKVVKTPKPKAQTAADPIAAQMSEHGSVYVPGPKHGKVQSLGSYPAGSMITLDKNLKLSGIACAKGWPTLHVQVGVTGDNIAPGAYITVEIEATLSTPEFEQAQLNNCPKVATMSGSGTQYQQLTIPPVAQGAQIVEVWAEDWLVFTIKGVVA